MGAKNASSALAAKEKGKKTAADVSAKEKALKDARLKAAAVVKRAITAAARARVHAEAGSCLGLN